MKAKDLVCISSGDQESFIKGVIDSKLVTKFTNLDWESILNNDRDGSYAEFCDANDGFLKLDTNNVENLLNLNSERFIPYFDKHNIWKIVFGNTWMNLIKKDKSFFDLCVKHYGFKNFDSFDWVNLLALDYNYKHLLDEYNVWDKFNGFNWADILTNHSDFIKKDDEYKITEKINSYGKFLWFKLLMENEIFLEYCDKFNAWKFFFKEYWVDILGKYPNLINKCDTLKEFTEEEWIKLIKNQPKLSSKYVMYYKPSFKNVGCTRQKTKR